MRISMMPTVKKIVKKMRYFFSAQESYTPEMLFEVERFHRDWPGFRTLDTCSRETGFSLQQCDEMKRILYKNSLLGNYFFAQGEESHSFMRSEIHRRIPSLTSASVILEVGSGNTPVFSPEEYSNWIMCDTEYNGSAIEFREFPRWGNRYPPDRSFTASWDTMGGVLKDWRGKCDLVFGCHSYEHVYRPVTALRQAAMLLKPRGWLALFIPDGFSDDPSNHDPTHTLYVVPGMLEDFLGAAGGFSSLCIEPFRPNADLIVLAQRSDT